MLQIYVKLSAAGKMFIWRIFLQCFREDPEVSKESEIGRFVCILYLLFVL